MSGIAHCNDGKPSNPVPQGSYFIPVNIRASAATAAATLWAMRNGTTRNIHIRRIRLNSYFDGTAAASLAQYALKRFSAATPTGGASILTSIAKKKSSMPASTIIDARFVDTGLTVAGVSFETGNLTFGSPRQNGAAGVIQLDFDVGGDENFDSLVLAPSEGLAIQNLATAVIGDSIIGYIEFDEHLLANA